MYSTSSRGIKVLVGCIITQPQTPLPATHVLYIKIQTFRHAHPKMHGHIQKNRPKMLVPKAHTFTHYQNTGRVIEICSSRRTSYLIFVNFGTPLHYISVQKYAKKCIFLRQNSQNEPKGAKTGQSFAISMIESTLT